MGKTKKLMRDQEIYVPIENPFKNCLFDRQKLAEILQNLIDNNTNGFVLALNNSWGSGKTTFIKMFEQNLNNNGFETIYFNAWESDYDTDPLISIIGELNGLTNKKTEENIKKVITSGSKLLITGVKSAIKHQIKKHAGDDVVDIFEDLIDKGQSLIEDEINHYSERKKNIKDFNQKLIDYITSRENQKPIVFIIDELDRCKPTYSVELLEVIKHFFNVPNIVFVLSIDKVQLSSAIKGYYGSETIDSNEYLKKIIDIELSLPDPDYKDYIHKKTKDFIFPDLQKFYIGIHNNGIYPDFYEFFCLIFLENGSSTRKLNKILSHCYLSVLCFNDYKKLNVLELFYLIYLKDENNSLYLSIKNNKFNNDVITEELIRLFEKAKNKKFLKIIIFDLLIFFDIDLSILNPDLFRKIQKIGSVNLDNDTILKNMRKEFNNNNMREPSDYIPIIEFLYNE